MMLLRLVLAAFFLLFPSGSFAEDSAQAAPADTAFEDRLDFGYGLYERGMYDMAIEEFQAALREFPGHPDILKAQFGEAETFFFLKRYPEAMGKFMKLLETKPDSPERMAWIRRIGECLFYIDSKEEAKGVFALIQKENNPENFYSAKYYQARIALDGKDYENAAKIFGELTMNEEAASFKVSANYYLGEISLENKGYEEALAYYEKAAQDSDPRMKQMALFGLAKVHFLMENYVKAAEVFRAVSEDPADPVIAEDAFLNLAHALYNQGEDGALQILHKENKRKWLDPAKKGDFYFLTARSLTRSSAFDAADALLAAMQVDNNTPADIREKAALQRIENLIAQKKNTEALAMTQEVASVIQKHKDHLAYLTSVIVQQAGDREKTELLLKEFLAHYPSSEYADEIYLLYGYELSAAQRWEEAIRVLDEFVRAYSGHELASKALSDIILIQAKLNRHQEAIETAERFLAMYPDRPVQAEEVHRMLASLYSRLREHKKAAEIYKEHLEKYELPEDRNDLYFDMAYNFQQGGQWTEALEYYSKMNLERATPELRHQALSHMAYSAMNLDDHARAAKLYYDLIVGFPDKPLEPDVYLWLMEELVHEAETKRLEEVIVSFSKQPAADKHAARLAYYTGLHFWLAGDNGKAIENLDRSVTLDAAMAAPVALAKARLHVQKSEWDAAMKSYEEALSKAASNHEMALEARMGIGDVFFSQKKFHEASKAYLAIGILFDDAEWVPQALYKAAETFDHAGDPANAEKVRKELRERFPDHALSTQTIKHLEKTLA